MKSNDDLEGFVDSVVTGSLISVSGNDDIEFEGSSDQEEIEEISEEESAAESGEENETESEIVTYTAIDYSDRFTNIENSQYIMCAELLGLILLIGILTGLKRL